MTLRHIVVRMDRACRLLFITLLVGGLATPAAKAGDALSRGDVRGPLPGHSNSAGAGLRGHIRSADAPLASGWTKKLIADGGAAYVSFGKAVALNGETAVVGALGSDSGKGSAYIYSRNQGGADAWGQVKVLTATTGVEGDAFGAAVAIDADTVVVGAPGSDSGKGSAYIYGRNQGGIDAWGRVQVLTATEVVTGYGFGDAVAIAGDTVVVGMPLQEGEGGNTGQGAVYIFGRNQGGADAWGLVKKLTIADGAAGDEFGAAVAIDEDTIVVGAIRHYVDGGANQGAAFIFGRDQGGADTWGLVKEVIVTDGAAGDHFGAAVAIDEDAVVVGAPYHNSNRGGAYIFARDQGGANTWGLVKEVTGADEAQFDHFGHSVAVAGDVVAVGAPDHSVGSTSDQGAAYVFVRNRGETGAWGQAQYLAAADGAENDEFGSVIALSGDIILAGAPNKNSAYLLLVMAEACYLPLIRH